MEKMYSRWFWLFSAGTGRHRKSLFLLEFIPEFRLGTPYALGYSTENEPQGEPK
ncbi:MAG: hypothetical protein WCH44_09880 [Betaproteobacteria bacterium]